MGALGGPVAAFCNPEALNMPEILFSPPVLHFCDRATEALSARKVFLVGHLLIHQRPLPPLHRYHFWRPCDAGDPDDEDDNVEDRSCQRSLCGTIRCRSVRDHLHYLELNTYMGDHSGDC